MSIRGRWTTAVRRRDRGATLIEQIIAVTILGTVGVAFLALLATMTHVAGTRDVRAKAVALISNAAAQAIDLRFIPCASAADYNAAGGLPDGTLVRKVEHWTGSGFGALPDLGGLSAALAPTGQPLVLATDPGPPLAGTQQVRVGRGGDVGIVTAVFAGGTATARAIPRDARAPTFPVAAPVTLCPRLQRLALATAQPGTADHTVVVSKRGPISALTASAVLSPDVLSASPSKVHYEARLTGADRPTGTLVFELFPAGPAGCLGPALASVTSSVTTNDKFVSLPVSDVVVANAGDYRWTVSYSGDATNLGASSGCAPLSLAKARPATLALVDLTPPPAYGLHTGASLTGLINPIAGAGTMTYELYGPDDPLCAASARVFHPEPVPVTGNGGQPASGTYTPTHAGSYRWVAAYSGDANNPAVGPTPCGPDHVVLVPKATPVFTPQNATGAVGSAVQLATVAGQFTVTGPVTFYLYLSSDGTGCADTPERLEVAGTAANGVVTSVALPPETAGGTFAFRVGFGGDADNNASACSATAATLTVSP